MDGGDPSSEFVAVQPRHPKVGDEQIRGSRPLTDESQSAEAIRCALHLITSTGEDALHEVEHERLVVDDQDRWGGIRHCGRFMYRVSTNLLFVREAERGARFCSMATWLWTAALRECGCPESQGTTHCVNTT
jgi:hypothetical protein